MKILCIGGGPAGLYFGICMKQQSHLHEVTILERNRPDDTFGFGTVISNSSLDYLHQHDAETYELIRGNCQLWEAIEVRFGGKVVCCDGNSFSAISRQRLLNLLQQKALDLGVDIQFQTDFASAARFKQYDLIVAADGVNSTVRRMFTRKFRPAIEVSATKYIWFGTTQHFDALTFLFAENEHGIFGVQAYPDDECSSTFIVETDEETWHRAGLDHFLDNTLDPGKSDLESMDYCQNLFASHLSGHELLANNSKWLNFRTIQNETWHSENIVLIGDAAHTAHFSAVLGTKIAMEDALALSLTLQEHADIPTALEAYERVRRPEVEHIQGDALPSIQWWEDFRRYKHFSPEQFTFNFLTRTPGVTYESLKLRDPQYIAQIHAWFLANTTPAAAQSVIDWEKSPPPPMAQPLQLRAVPIAHRLALSLPIQFTITAQSTRKRSTRITFLTDIFAEVLAKEYIGLVIAQPSAEQYEDFMASHRLLQVDPMFHDVLGTRVGLHIPALFSELAPENINEALQSQLLPRYTDMARLAVSDQYDLLELNFTRGSLPYKFISAASNTRTDSYGGSLQQRMRFPLTVLDAVRSIWPDERPLAIRLSIPEQGELDDDELLKMIQQFGEQGCDLISIEIGDAPAAHDAYATHLRQRHLSDRISNELAMPTMLIGGAANDDEINTHILSGRTDLYLFG